MMPACGHAARVIGCMIRACVRELAEDVWFEQCDDTADEEDEQREGAGIGKEIVAPCVVRSRLCDHEKVKGTEDSAIHNLHDATAVEDGQDKEANEH